jgi:hypothetical protein
VSLYHHNLKKNQAKKLFFRLDNNDKFKTAEMEKRWLPFVAAVGSCVQNHFYKRPSSRLNLLKTSPSRHWLWRSGYVLKHGIVYHIDFEFGTFLKFLLRE